jgi:hypothetical protein
MVKNEFDCPFGIWNDFTDEEKLYYNKMLKELSYKNHTLFLHPDSNRMTPDEWDTLVHHIITVATWRIKNNDIFIYEKD